VPAPPPDAPTPSEQDAASAAAAFAPSPPAGPSVCGFALPGLPPFPPSFNLSLPDFGFPPAWLLPPLPTVCDLAKVVADGVADGGGRVGTKGLEDDPEDE
jgi:hypothetical protein